MLSITHESYVELRLCAFASFTACVPVHAVKVESAGLLYGSLVPDVLVANACACSSSCYDSGTVRCDVLAVYVHFL